MTNKKITDLVELTTPTTDDVFPLVDIATNSTKKAQLANLPISTATQTALDAKQATLVSGTNIKTINSTSLLGSGDISISANPAGTAGQIQFSDGSAFAADSNLFWDNTNKRLGVGETTPTARVQIKGATTGAESSLKVQNSAGSDLLNVRNDGIIILPGGNYINGNDFNGNFRFINTSSFSVASSVGINLFAPIANTTLAVKGSGSTSATTALLVQNSAGTAALTVKDDLSATFGGDFTQSGNITQISNGSYFTIRGNSAYILGQSDRISLYGSPITLGTNAAPNASAVVDVVSTTKGFLPPRMTTTQKNAIASPASGLMVYDTTTNKLCCYNGTSWNDLF